ncbi:AraC family transcriptional regulator ligand-binding domain-containing protein [Halopseudomonas sp.]|jgi:AraC-like DNA-binding protein|uniref:AraC family transcriptional regulator n=1 Tax=Halopseudomonas sp. TaxID=2901191 RepID=UPI0039E388DF
MGLQPSEWRVPSSYSRVVARELDLAERELALLLSGTGLPTTILLPGDESHLSAAQQLRILENAQSIMSSPEFGLRLGCRLKPSSHGPMGYLVLSSPDVLTAMESFAEYLPLRLPFSAVQITQDADWLTYTLQLKVDASPAVRRVLQECFALMLQSVVESVVDRELTESRIGLAHGKPAYHRLYAEYLHCPVQFSQPANTFQVPIELALQANAAGHSESYAVARALCRGLLEHMPSSQLSTRDRVRRLLLSNPAGTMTANDVARALFVTKRTLQRRLELEGTSYRGVTESLLAELATRHLGEGGLTIESVAVMLGYNDTAAFRKAFHRWFGQSPSDYRAAIKSAAGLTVAALDQ